MPTGVKGFTLIEFLVASSLAIIVIMAAGSTYFFTRRLNDNAQTRIDRQNALRNAATAISRDARVAGSFGCFVTGGAVNAAGSAAQTTQANTGDFPAFPLGGANIRLNNNDVSGYGVAVLSQADAGTVLNPAAGIDFASDALVFIYGKGNAGAGVAAGTDFDNLNTVILNGTDPDVNEAIANSGRLVVSSCSDAYTVSSGNGSSNTELKFSNTSTKFTAEKIGELSVSKMYAAAYVLADINGGRGLLRYETQADGEWGEPQLLVSNITDLSMSFAYADSCDVAAELPAEDIRFAYSDVLNHRNLPALIQIQLNYEDGIPPYIINANVRGGNVCANIDVSNS